VIRAIDFEGPDRIPINFYPDHLPRTEKIRKLTELYPKDIFSPTAETGGYRKENCGYRKGYSTDEWGCVWRNISKYNLRGQVVGHPLEDWAKLETYSFPDPQEYPNLDNYEENVKAGHGRGRYVSAGLGYRGFHRLVFLRGFANLMKDLVLKRRELKVLMDMLLDFNLEGIKRLLEFDVDGIEFGDDWGTNTGLMINPNLWQEYFEPFYKRMFDLVHKAGRHVLFHSDGYILDIIPDLIEIGANTLNIQEDLMGIDTLAERFGGKVCIIPSFESQHILYFGEVNAVKHYVVKQIYAFGSFDGGMMALVCPIPTEPIKNLITNTGAVLQTLKKKGRYPIGR